MDATLGVILCTYIVCLLPTDNLTTIFYVIFTFWRNLYFLICRETLDHLMRLCLRKYPCGLQYFWNREENAEYCLPIGWMSVICCSQLRLQVVFFPVPKEALRVLNKAEKQSDAPEYSNTILNHILQSRSPPHKVEKMKKTIWHASKWQWDIHAWCFYWKKLVRQLLSCSWIRHLSFILLWGRGGDYLLWTNLMLLQKD